jgi:hypothetical protein
MGLSRSRRESATRGAICGQVEDGPDGRNGQRERFLIFIRLVRTIRAGSMLGFVQRDDFEPGRGWVGGVDGRGKPIALSGCQDAEGEGQIGVVLRPRMR